jgi:hypothetical protein
VVDEHHGRKGLKGAISGMRALSSTVSELAVASPLVGDAIVYQGALKRSGSATVFMDQTAKDVNSLDCLDR